MDDLERIEELYETVKNDSSNFQAVRELSIALLDNGFNEEALKQLVYLVGIFPEDARLYFNIGYAFEKLKMQEKAEYSYRKAISLDENCADYVYNLGYLLLNANKKLDEATECFNKVLELEPNDANTYFNLGIINMKQEDYNSAVENFKKAYELNNLDTLALFYMGNAYHKLNLLEDAKRVYEIVTTISPEYTWAYYNIAQIAWQNGEVEEAIYNLQKVLELNSKDIKATKLLAQIYLKLEDYDSATKILKNAISQNPYNGDLYYFMAKASKGDKNDQIKYFKKALENYKNLSISVQQIKSELKSVSA